MTKGAPDHPTTETLLKDASFTVKADAVPGSKPLHVLSRDEMRTPRTHPRNRCLMKVIRLTQNHHQKKKKITEG